MADRGFRHNVPPEVTEEVAPAGAHGATIPYAIDLEEPMPSHSQPPNAFAAEFLERMAERDEPATAGEAETAGTAQVVPAPQGGFAVLGEGLSLEEGDRPVAILRDRSTALLVAAALSASSREPTYRLGKEAGEHGFPLYEQGRIAGHLTWFDEGLMAGINHFDRSIRMPASLSQLLEAGGGLALERAGRLLERRTRRSPSPGEPPAAPETAV
jgi:hypothetical protein